MELDIPNNDLARLASDPTYTGGLARDVVDLYRQALQIMAAVPDEPVLRQFQCLRYTTVRGPGARRRITLANDASLVVRIRNHRKKDPTVIVERIDRNGRKK